MVSEHQHISSNATAFIGLYHQIKDIITVPGRLTLARNSQEFISKCKKIHELAILLKFQAADNLIASVEFIRCWREYEATCEAIVLDVVSSKQEITVWYDGKLGAEIDSDLIDLTLEFVEDAAKGNDMPIRLFAEHSMSLQDGLSNGLACWRHFLNVNNLDVKEVSLRRARLRGVLIPSHVYNGDEQGSRFGLLA